MWGEAKEHGKEEQETVRRSSTKTLRRLWKRRRTEETNTSGLPEAPMRTVRREARSRRSHRLQTREAASQADLWPSSRRKTSWRISSGRSVLIRSPPLISSNAAAEAGGADRRRPAASIRDGLRVSRWWRWGRVRVTGNCLGVVCGRGRKERL